MNDFLVDSDIFLNTLVETERQDICVRFLDAKEGKIYTTILNIMEISSVLSRKYKWKKEDIHEVVNTVEKGMEVVIPTEAEIIHGYEFVMKYFFSPVDAILLALSENQNQHLITYNGELLKRGSEFTTVSSPKKWIE